MAEIRARRPPGYLPVVNRAHPDLIFTEIRGGRLQTLAFEMCASQHAHKTSGIYRDKIHLFNEKLPSAAPRTRT